MYHFSIKAGKTSVQPLRDAGGLALALEDLGIRNSDVLLSDAVLFVEGSADRLAVNAWSQTLGQSLAERNITILPVGGTEATGISRARADVLRGVSQKTSVPHLFLFDRDERSDDEITEIVKVLNDSAVFLQRRELENYLLHPRVLKTVIRNKVVSGQSDKAKIDASSEEAIEALVTQTADELFGLVLLKRIRTRIPPLKGGIFPRELTSEFLAEATGAKLGRRIREKLENRQREHMAQIDFEEIVNSERQNLAELWKHKEKRRLMAPGVEIVERIFNEFDLTYTKPGDTGQLAAEMAADEIPQEIKDLVTRISSLPDTR